MNVNDPLGKSVSPVLQMYNIIESEAISKPYQKYQGDNFARRLQQFDSSNTIESYVNKNAMNNINYELENKMKQKDLLR